MGANSQGNWPLGDPREGTDNQLREGDVPRSVSAASLPAFLIGLIAGLGAMTAPAAVAVGGALLIVVALR